MGDFSLFPQTHTFPHTNKLRNLFHIILKEEKQES